MRAAATDPRNPVLNAIANPSFEVNTTGWSVGSNAAIARDTSQSQFGAASLKLSRLNTTPGNGNCSRATTLPAGLCTASAWIKPLVSGVVLNLDNVASVSVPTVGVWQQVFVTAVTGANPRLYVGIDTNLVAGDHAYIDGVILSRGRGRYAFADPNSSTAWKWLGAANASQSVGYTQLI